MTTPTPITAAVSEPTPLMRFLEQLCNALTAETSTQVDYRVLFNKFYDECITPTAPVAQPEPAPADGLEWDVLDPAGGVYASFRSGSAAQSMIDRLGLDFFKVRRRPASPAPVAPVVDEKPFVIEVDDEPASPAPKPSPDVRKKLEMILQHAKDARDMSIDIASVDMSARSIITLAEEALEDIK